ncbi:MAG: beta-lactamase family protein [Acidimicrobiaceae bacterium]|nr:serine hydrolase [Acidimicrobiaceae bacterium]MXY09866.1 beta-lactamase family protein [Acidimicrobiaceae bacterium]MXZ65741.1 beta-lactamase family protein [Acidimicrobiaceae bacterium]MYF32460.1 beta-lactamase family protein [Acidimicrobiaceae bacterium]MYG77209.1 beta-lactamase family protein [Acidimicrobiaceae bacterium]
MALQDDVQTILERGVSDGDVVGAVAQVVTGDGTLAAAAAGKRSADPDAGAGAMTLDTVCWIASMTKAITGTAAMQLVEQGRLDLDAPASGVVPSLAEVGVLEGFDDDGQPQVRPARSPITLRHLLTHTAGFGYEFWTEELLRYQQATGVPSVTTCELASLTAPALFDPGERWWYGTNIDYAGLMVQEVSGQRLGDYLDEHVLGPLGMDSTNFRISEDMAARQSAMHARLPDGSLVAIEFGLPPEPEFQMGGGGLYGTVGDYCRFLQMILGRGSRNGARLLQPETVDQMAANSMGDVRVVALPAVIPDLTNEAEFFPGIEKSWGLTFQINEEPLPTGRPAGGLMWAGLANSFFWIDMANQVAGAYISQQLPFADSRSYQLYEDIETATYASL